MVKTSPLQFARFARPWRVIGLFDRRFVFKTIACASLGLLSGCALTSRPQLDECRQRSQALHAENAKLRDQVLALRSQNQDMAQRAVDDARVRQRQEDAIKRLDRSIIGYQEEREKLATAYDRLKSRVESSATPEASNNRDSLRRFATAHPGSSFDDQRGVLTLASEQIFAPGANRFQSEGEKTLKDLASALATIPGPKGEILISAETGDPMVVKAGLDSDQMGARQQFLAMARSALVRDYLAKAANLDPARFRVLSEEQDPAPSAGKGLAANPQPVVEIHLQPVAAKNGPSGP